MNDSNFQRLSASAGQTTFDAPRVTSLNTFTKVDEPTDGSGADFDGKPGEYSIIFMLAIPGRDTVVTELNAADFGVKGDSLIVMPTGTVDVKVTVDFPDIAEPLQIVAGVNEEGRLRDVKMTVEARNFYDASVTAHNLIRPLLSRWAFIHDVSITTRASLITELTTGSMLLEAVVCGRAVDFCDEGLPQQSTPEHRLLFSAYREGLSSVEPLWQALSFLRVCEGVRGLAKSRGRDDPSGTRIREEVIAVHSITDESVKSAMLEFDGVKLNRAIDKLHDRLRNAIAHLDLSRDAQIAYDLHADLSKVIPALPALRWVARRLLEIEIEG